MAAMVPRASVADNQTTARLQNPLCGSARPVLTHPHLRFYPHHGASLGSRFGRLGLGATLRKIPSRKSRVESVVPAPVPPIRLKFASRGAEKFEDAGFMRPQPPRATHTSKQEPCKFSSRLVSRPASISPDPLAPGLVLAARVAARPRAARSRGKNEDKSDPRIR